MTASAGGGRQVPVGFVLTAGLASVTALATILVIPRTAPWITTHAGASTSALVADLAAGLGLLLAGVLIARERSGQRNGLLVVLAGVAWFAPIWIGWQGGPVIVRSTAAIVAPMFVPLLVHMVAILPGQPADGRLVRITVMGSYIATLSLAITRALVDDPTLDPTCWANCTDTAFLAASDPALAGRLREMQLVLAGTGGLVVAAIAMARLVTATTPARRALWPALVPAALVGAMVLVRASTLLIEPVDDPRRPVHAVSFLLLAWSVAVFAAGLIGVKLRVREVRATLARLGSQGSESARPGSVALALARATGDPSLEIRYPVHEPEGWVNGMGIAVDPPVSDTRRELVRIVREGELVAVMGHDPGVVALTQLEREIGPATQLVIENERLQAGVLASLEDLQRSRARIVETGDEERRRLERDLHDGAQQRLLALSYDLRTARATAVRDDLPEVVPVLDRTIEAARAAHAALRDLAHGIYPAILAESGLRAALETLADRSSVAVRLVDVADDLPEALEPTVYRLVEGALEDAAQRHAASVTVSVARGSGRVTVAVDDDGIASAVPPVHLADRAGAAGGELEPRSLEPALGINRLIATLPCA